jgi:hypothetical protein
MPMAEDGLAKLAEELGELQQVVGKMLAYIHLRRTRLENHPDGTILLERLEQEIADVQASISFVEHKLNLNSIQIIQRRHVKLTKFFEWEKDTCEPRHEHIAPGSWCSVCGWRRPFQF